MTLHFFVDRYGSVVVTLVGRALSSPYGALPITVILSAGRSPESKDPIYPLHIEDGSFGFAQDDTAVTFSRFSLWSLYSSSVARRSLATDTVLSLGKQK